MSRPLLDQAHVHPAAGERMAQNHADTLHEVQSAIASHPVVVVGMAQNPFCRKARKALDGAGIAHHDLDYGSYLSEWQRRLALKIWSGWPTLPMVFVKGTLVGGADDVARLIASGELQRMLA